MIIPNDTVIVIADGENLKLFRNKGSETHLRLVTLPSPKLDVHNQGSGFRHRSSLANPDEKRLEEDNFAAAAAAFINTNVQDGEFSSLFIIADPRTLGEMRRHFHPSAASSIIGELAKDLIHQTTAELETILNNA